ncbi:hypothetical protein CR513_56926, partial [Mucuna pruriens]
MKTYHPKQQILRKIQNRVITIYIFKGQAQVSIFSKVEPKNIEDALLDEGHARRTRSVLERWIVETSLSTKGQIHCKNKIGLQK